MQGKLTTIKNLAWALAIVVTLLALLLGLLFAAFSRYDGEMERPTVQLGAAKTASGTAQGSDPADPDAPVQSSTGRLIRLGETADAGQAYIDSLTFLCDSTTAGLLEYSMLSGGSASTQVWCGETGSLPVGTLANCLIKYPNDGSVISPAEAAMVSKPGILMLCIGQDGLMDVDQEGFVANYEALIRSIQAASPKTVIVCCSIPFVGAGYSGTDGLTPDAISWANDWVQQVCIETGVYFCDVANAMRDSTNVLTSGFTTANNKTLNRAGLSFYLQYLRTHAVQ